jgi:hypothetical protein
VGRRGRGAKTSSPFPAGVGGRPGSRWSRSRANPATWWGPRRAAAKAARSSEERRKRRPEGEKTTPAATKRESKAAKAPESSRRRKWTWRRKKKAAGASKPGDSDKAADGDATSTGADTKKSTDAKGSTDPKKDSAKSPTATASPAPDTTKTVPRITRQPKPSVPKPSEAPAFKDDVLLFDEMGFPTRPNPAPRTPPSTNSGARKPVTATPVVTAPAATIQRSSNMSDTVDNPYAHLIDSSSKATFRASTREAADQARKDAQEREEKAAKLRGQAQSWIEKGSDDIAQPLLQEAARLEEDASTRRQAAAAYESV